jgi:hypothetical protein
LEKEGTGVLVLSVRPGGPADVAGIKGIRWGPFGRGLIPGDIITSLNGKPINTERDVYTELDRCKVGHLYIAVPEYRSAEVAGSRWWVTSTLQHLWHMRKKGCSSSRCHFYVISVRQISGTQGAGTLLLVLSSLLGTHVQL